MRKAIAALLLFFVSCPFSAFSAEEPGFTIRFADKKIYFLGDSINIEIAITNDAAQTLRFKMADNRFFNLDFTVRTPTNIQLEHAKDFSTARNSDQPIFFREVSLQPGEKFGIVIDLTTFIDMKDPGLYIVEAQFFPELARGAQPVSMKSNKLSLSVKPPVVTAEEREKVELETGKLIARVALPPDEVIIYTLKARQQSQWERFFLYMDLESLLRKSPERDRAFKPLSQEKRAAMVEKFKADFRAEKIDEDIITIPRSFEIRKTSYTPIEATVLVREKFTYPDYLEVKEYTYYLQKRDQYWIIYNYEIKNIGTEAKPKESAP